MGWLRPLIVTVGASPKNRRHALDVECRGGHDHLEIRAARQEAAQHAEQEIDVEGSFVRLIDDDRIVAAQEGVGLELGQEQPVGHQHQPGRGGHAVGETHAIPHGGPKGLRQLFRDARRERPRRDAPRLGVADETRHAPPELQANLRKLRALS